MKMDLPTPRITGRTAVLKKYRISVSLYVVFFSVVLFPSCYSSTAVMGTPVKELIKAGDPRVSTGVKDRETVQRLSELDGMGQNRTFTEISGIPEYRIGPLDLLEVNSHIGDKVTQRTLTVDNRGRITYSFIDDLDVAGLTPSQLDALLTERLSNFIKNPRIDILVKEFNSKSVTILGELSSLRSTNVGQAGSGRIYLEGKTTLMDLIAMAGGYTVDADIKKVKLVRKGRAYLVNIYDILEKADESQNVILDDGDVVDVPSLPEFGERVYVMGEVEEQGIYSLKDARDLLGAISLAGSFTQLAKEKNTLVVRGYPHSETPLVMMVDLNALLTKADLAQNIPLKDGDLVYVPRMLIADINDWIENTTPLLDFLFYPTRFQANYFTRDYLHINPK